MRGIQRQAGSFRLASYNVRKCVGMDRRRRPDRVLGVIADLDADIVALQEADRRLGARPSTLSVDAIHRATGLVPLPIADNDVSLGWHGNAVLVKPEFTLKALQRIDLPGFEPRGAVLIELSRGVDRIQLVATHLGLIRNNRRKQLNEISASVAMHAHLPTAILGDLNEWRSRSHPDDLPTKFTLHSPGHSYPTLRPLAGLDRFAYCNGFSLLDSGVHKQGEARIASDHFPVWADFELKTTAPIGLAPCQD